MKTCQVQFNEGGREYTYLTHGNYAPGTKVFAEVGATDVKLVTVVEMHTDDRRDPNAKFEYRWVLGTEQELRAWMHVTRTTHIILASFTNATSRANEQ